jgi:hypothetical protein
VDAIVERVFDREEFRMPVAARSDFGVQRTNVTAASALGWRRAAR